MRVAIIGLGAIARKAYLPVLASTAGVTPVLVTRNRETLAEVGAAYRIPDLFTCVDDAIAAGLDAAFVHTPSPTHPAIASTLLRAGIPALVDKPLGIDLESAQQVVALATELDSCLMVGFNRRYAPAYRAVAQWPDLDVVTLHKHRQMTPGPARAMVFDDFIHVVDTLRYLVPSTLADVRVRARVDDGGRCHRLSVDFTGDDGARAQGVMSWTAGMTHEVLDVIGAGRRQQITDLADVVDFAGQERLVRRDGWAPATQLRGFSAMCASFLAAVRAGRRLDANDALVTHELCEQIVHAAR